MSNRTWLVEFIDAPDRKVEAAGFEWNELTYIFDDGCQVVAVFPYSRVTAVTELVESKVAESDEKLHEIRRAVVNISDSMRGHHFRSAEAELLHAHVDMNTIRD